MLWLLYALVSDVFFAASNLTDKAMLGRIRYPHTVNIVGSFLIGIVAIVLLFVRPRTLTPTELLASLAIGVLGFLAVAFYLIAMQREEASRVSPLWSFTDILVPVLAFVTLREPLTMRIIAAMLLVMVGSILMESDLKNGRLSRKPRVLLLMFAASLSWAVTLILSRAFLAAHDEVTLWTFSAFGAFAAALVPLLWARQKILADLRLRITMPGTIISTGTEAVGVLARFAALARFFVAPVQLVGGLQFVFVFFGAWFLSRWFPSLKEKHDRNTVVTKFLAMLLITLGITLVATTGE